MKFCWNMEVVRRVWDGCQMGLIKQSVAQVVRYYVLRAAEYSADIAAISNLSQNYICIVTPVSTYNLY